MTDILWHHHSKKRSKWNEYKRKHNDVLLWRLRTCSIPILFQLVGTPVSYSCHLCQMFNVYMCRYALPSSHRVKLYMFCYTSLCVTAQNRLTTSRKISTNTLAAELEDRATLYCGYHWTVCTVVWDTLRAPCTQCIPQSGPTHSHTLLEIIFTGVVVSWTEMKGRNSDFTLKGGVLVVRFIETHTSKTRKLQILRIISYTN